MTCLKYRVIIILLSILLVREVKAVEESNIQSAFLAIGIGARAMGLGGAYTSLATGSESAVWNPAGLIDQEAKHSGSSEHVTMMDLYDYNYLSYSLKNSELFGAGIAATYSGGDDMSESTFFLTSALNLKYFEDWQSLPQPLKAELQKFSVGINAKYFYASFGHNKDGEYLQDDVQMQNQGSSNGYGLDLGLKYFLDEKSTLSCMARNVLTNIYWDTSRSRGSYSEDLPAAMIFGYSFQGEHIIVAFDYDKAFHTDTEDYVALGLEYRFLDKTIAIRSGYSQELFTGENKHYAIGAGYSLRDWYSKKITVDCSYEINSVWQDHNNLRFSLKLDI